MIRFRRRLVDLGIFAVALALLAMFAGIFKIDSGKISLAPHYVWQVQAWLDGRFDLGPSPGPWVVDDKITVNGHYYSMYPPFPAMVMLPFVWLLGDGFSDVWFTWAVAALNVVLVFRTLELMRHRRITRRTTLENLVLAAVFGFGTIMLWLSLAGMVWFTGQLMSTTLILLVLHSTICRRWWPAWLGVGLIALTRTTEMVVGVVPALVYLRDLGVGRRTAGRWNFRPARWPSLREVAATVVPLAVCGAVLLARNKLYFGSITSTGYDIHSANDVVVFPYGLMNWHYIWPNFVIDFLRFPDFSYTGVNDAHPVMDLRAGGMGTSIFFSTPLMLLFLVSSQGKAADRWMRTVMWAGTAALFLPVIMFQAAGYDQVGARYLLPIYPTLFLLLAMRADRIGPRWLVLAGLGIFSNILLAKAFWAGPPSSQFAWTSGSIVAAVGVLTHWLLAREHRARPGTDAQAPAPDDGGTAHRDHPSTAAEAVAAS
ncbi:hypothetical protein Kpho02_49750 [Kitasatospora phosalacinea]|uniref:DUF2029 domain-containing protein n=1 Tax=Kitasatospora phosalacinea TaxID=2065 RepID=A0A9W6V2H7_9ACTN|nr:hypothetical protein [Kitasatospora phosalacinea]GLW72676.1 hypothetical protein Kpho02_49750 [Kitasatospora phosalacinea]